MLARGKTVSIWRPGGKRSLGDREARSRAWVERRRTELITLGFMFEIALDECIYKKLKIEKQKSTIALTTEYHVHTCTIPLYGVLRIYTYGYP